MRLGDGDGVGEARVREEGRGERGGGGGGAARRPGGWGVGAAPTAPRVLLVGLSALPSFSHD